MKRAAVWWILLALLVSACAAFLPKPRPAPVERRLAVEEGAEAPAVMPATEKTGITERPAGQTLPQRRIIYEASLELVVEDTERAAREATAIATDLGGYVVSANLYRVDDQVRGTMTVRVPQERFEEALERFRRLAVRVDREERRTQDVTTEYVDLTARLQNLEATEAELRALLSEVRQRTQRASDVMEVYRELTRVREEIETLKGRLQMLDQLSALATIHLTFIPYELRQPVPAQRWDPRLTLRRAWGTLVVVGRFLVDAGIYFLVVGIPVLSVLTAVGVLVVRLARALVRRRRPAGE